MSEIPKKYRGIYSIENRTAHGAEDRDIEQVDEFVVGRWKYIIYQDSEGQYWYKNLIKVNNRFVSMEEAIFGKKAPVRYTKHN